MSAIGCINTLFRLFIFGFVISVSALAGVYAPSYGLLMAILSVLWLISRWIPKFPLRTYFGWLLLGLFIAFFVQYRQLLSSNLQLEKTPDGAVMQHDPVDYSPSGRESGLTDKLYRKSIAWFDFGQRSYHTKFYTTGIGFKHSRSTRNSLRQLALGDNQISYMAALYEILSVNDTPKLDSLVADLKNKAINKNLNALQTAEMVTTMVQEIDYVLVHANSCKQSSKEDGDFVCDYHRENKPCLPNTFAGVQSPYEFAHNLKGDCDTRTLLAHTLLTRLGISSSIWISTVYGHSVLGVGVPAGFGSYKEINGVKHYGVEITNKGFKIGMLVPEQRNMRNWIVTNYKNF